MKFNTLIGFVLILLIVGTYFIGNFIHYGGSDITGYTSCGFDTPYQLSFLLQLFAQTLYLALAGAGIAFMTFFSGLRRFKLFGLVILSLFLLIAWTGIVGFNVHGRYIDVLVPLMLIGAFSYKKDISLLLYGFSVALVSIWFFNMFWRDTINCFSNIYYITPHIQYLFVAFLFVMFLYLLFTTDRKKVVSIMFIILILTFMSSNVINFQRLNRNSDYIFEIDNIGKYINENKINGIVMDETMFEGNITIWRRYFIMNFYNKEFIPLGNESEQYFISSKTLPYTVLAVDRPFSTAEDSRKNLYLYRVSS